MSSREESGWLEKLTPLLRELMEEGVLDPHWRKDSEDPETPRGVVNFFLWNQEEKCFVLRMTLPTRAGVKLSDWPERTRLDGPRGSNVWKLLAAYHWCGQAGSWEIFEGQTLADESYDLHFVRDKDMPSYSLEAAHRDFFDLRGGSEF
jgi:hypothetical protein